MLNRNSAKKTESEEITLRNKSLKSDPSGKKSQ